MDEFESMKGRTCEACHQGTYDERSIHDDIDGTYTCDHCYHRTPARRPRGPKTTERPPAAAMNETGAPTAAERKLQAAHEMSGLLEDLARAIASLIAVTENDFQKAMRALEEANLAAYAEATATLRARINGVKNAMS